MRGYNGIHGMHMKRRNLRLWTLLPGMLALSSCGGGGSSNVGASFTLGGYVSGLTGSGLTLSYNGAPLPISRNGAFTASNAVTTGSTYTIAVATQPTNPAQTCVVSNGSGTVGTANVTSVRVFCPQPTGVLAYVVTGGNPPLVLGSIAVYAIAPSTGMLTLVPGSAVSTGSSVVSFQLVPGSPFAWALNFGSSITQADNGDIYDYTVNPTTGLLTANANNPFYVLNGNALTPPACPGGVSGLGLTDAVTFAASGAFGYAANAVVGSASNWGIWAFTFDPTSGAPTALASSAPACSSSPLTIDPSGQFAYFSGYASTALDSPGLYAFTIDATSGALTAVTGAPWTIGSTPNTVVTIDPTGQFAYAPEGNLIYAFAINPASGALAPIAGSPFMIPATVAAMAIEPMGQYAYVSTSQGLYAYSIDSSSGTLSAAGTLVALTNATTLQIEPSGQFLYVAAAAGAAGQQGTYGYSIEAATGALTAIAGSPFAVGAMSPTLMAIAN